MLFDKNGIMVDMGLEESDESTAMITEAAILDAYSTDELSDIMENHVSDLNKAVNEDILMERSIIRLDKAAKKSKAEKMSIFQIAREKKDRDFKKLLTVWKLERFLEEKLTKRYGAQAKVLAKKKMKDASKSKSKTVTNASGKVKNLLNIRKK